MQVGDIMTTDLVTVGREATLKDAAVAMLKHRAGSVLVIEDDTPIGIVTESDVLRAAASSDRPLDEIDVSPAMSEPLVTTTRTASVQTAIRTMADEGVKKLVVIDGIDLSGIVTMTDIALHLPEELESVRKVEDERGEWTT